MLDLAGLPRITWAASMKSSDHVRENMMRSGKSPFRFRIFYGWYVLAVSFVILFFTTGARFTIGVVFKPLMVEFGWDRAAVSLGFFINMTIYALSLIIAGRSYDRYGPKWVIVISSCFLSAGFMSLAFIDSLWQFSISYGFNSKNFVYNKPSRFMIVHSFTQKKKRGV